MSAIFSFLHNDDRILEFQKYLNRVKKLIDPVKIEVELDSKLEKRVQLKSIQPLMDHDYSELKSMILTNSVESQLLRSRLCHLRIEVYKHSRKLSDYVEGLKKYLFITHKNQLELLGLKTQADKNYIIDSCFLEASTFLTELQVLEQALVFFIEDLDKNLWTLKNLVSVLELSVKNKVGI